MKNICIIAFLLISSLAFAQDIIITTDAQKIDAKILEVSKTSIKYKETENLEGPTFVLETSEISSIIYANGKVTLYNQSETREEPKPQKKVEKEEPRGYKDLYVGLPERERTALIKYLDGYPKNMVAIKGDYSMIFDKRSRIYLDYDFDDADLVVYDMDATECEYSGDFSESATNYLAEQNKQQIIQSACDKFNSKMLGKKCKLLPINNLTADERDYVMLLHIKRIDIGNEFVSVMTGRKTTAGGAIIYGNIEIRKATTNELCSVLLVDRVQGLGSAYETLRIQQAIEEIISNKLFFIKEYKLYSKEM